MSRNKQQLARRIQKLETRAAGIFRFAVGDAKKASDYAAKLLKLLTRLYKEAPEEKQGVQSTRIEKALAEAKSSLYEAIRIRSNFVIAEQLLKR